MEQVVYTICYLLTLVGGDLACHGHCSCTDASIDFEDGQDVNCSGLYLDHLPSISGRILKLHFSSNRLEQIPESVNHLTELRELDFSNNRLRRIADNLFSNLTNLKVLNLSGNRLKGFTVNTLKGLSMLEKLDLHENAFSQLPLGMLQSLSTTIVAVCLGDNQWNCESCEFRETLKGYLTYEQNELANYCHREIPTCDSPPSLSGRAFTEVSLEEIPGCSEENSQTTSWNLISTTTDTSTEHFTVTDDFLNLLYSANSHTATAPSKVSDGKTVKGIAHSPRLQVPIAAVIVIVGVVLLIIFMVLPLMLWKMKRKSKKDNISCTIPSMEPSMEVSPRPLLPVRQLSPTDQPGSVASASMVAEYEEIPDNQGKNFDGYVTRKDISNTEFGKPTGGLGAVKKGLELYSGKIDNPDNNLLQTQSSPTMTSLQALGNESIPIECKSSDTTDETDLDRNAPYMEMRSSVVKVAVKDLYAPFNA